MFCYNCMRDIGNESNYCPHCGRNSYPDRTAHYLSAGSMLNNRYLIGNALGEDGFSITYIARDMNIDRRVAVKEYYPMGHVTRNSANSNQVELRSVAETEFVTRGTDRFISEAKIARQDGISDVRDIFSENNTVYVVTSLRELTEQKKDSNHVPLPYNDGFDGETPETQKYMEDIQSRKPAPKKKKLGGGMIALIVIASVVVVGLATTMIILFANKGKTDSSNTTTAPTTIAVTTVPTQKPTEQDVDTSVTMPDVKGKKLSDAEAQLNNLGLKVETTREPDATVAKDYIIRQSVDSGQILKKGDTVMLYVSDGYVETKTTKEVHPDPTFSSLDSSSDFMDETGKEYNVNSVTVNDNTCWATAGDGIDEWLEINANGDQWVNGVVLVNGNPQNYQGFSRITSVRFEFSDGTSIEKTISDMTNLQTIAFDREVRTNSIKMTITGVAEGTESLHACLAYIKPY